MKIGLHLINFDVPGGVKALPATFASAAKAAEQAGAEWFTMADHFYQMDNLWPAESPMLEVYTSLGYLAGQTERIKLVVLVNGVDAVGKSGAERGPPRDVSHALVGGVDAAGNDVLDLVQADADAFAGALHRHAEQVVEPDV
jgi:hypothetical protein